MTAKGELNLGKLSGIISAVDSLSAMSLNIATDDHPNKMPFTGILTRVGEPSDAPPSGSGGKLITISVDCAKRNLKTIIGMAVDYKPGFDGHDPKAKVGIITSANLKGNAIEIGGYIYANDFPDVAAEIKEKKDILGFSYEARDLYSADMTADPCVIYDLTFTGAAILFKNTAAYRTTRIEDAATQDEEKMTPELKEALDAISAQQVAFAATLTAMSATVTKLETANIAAANMLPKVEPHAAGLEKIADAMECDGIGGDPNNGHAVLLRRMAGSMRAEAAQGRLPSSWYSYASAEKPPTTTVAPPVVTAPSAELTQLISDVAALGTKITDLKASAAKTSPDPGRKTMAPAITALLAKAGIDLPANGEKMTIAALDLALGKCNLTTEKRLEIKSALNRSGAI